MAYVNLMGHIDDLDRVIEDYVARYDIQLEYASKELAETEGLETFNSDNPYAPEMRKCERIKKILSARWDGESSMTSEEAIKALNAAQDLYDNRDQKIKLLEQKKKALEDYMAILEPFSSLYFDMGLLRDFKLIHLCFGKMPLSNFKQLEAFLYIDPEILFIESSRSKEYVWGVYATPDALKEKIDSIFSSLHFERIKLANEFDGEKISGNLASAIDGLNAKLAEIDAEMGMQASVQIKSDPRKLAEAFAKIQEMYYVYEAKKFATKTPKDYFVFVGWMSEADAGKLQKEVAYDNKVIFLGDSHKVMSYSTPPTKLKNPPLIRYFEFFTAMYGLPSYGEIDPTAFLAVTYTLLFGLMFGDVGQGALVSALGLLLYKLKGLALGAIMAVIGVSSMLFGFLYGSVFGFEDWIPAIWRRPNDNITYTLFFAVGIGIFLIFSAMALNIANSIKQKNWAKLVFSPNGAAGFVFYAAVISLVLSIVLGHPFITVSIAIAFIIAPLILIAFREPLTKLAARKKIKLESTVPMFILETVIELFEVLLTYFTNTVSFVRVGAFALSHAGMMSVVLLLSRSEAGTFNPMVIVLGNAVVIALEGLVVGIQVLRLQFYEMFSRFFEGEGRAFESYKGAKPSK
jgi:V/A-type H+-transporting ATPase subunit I